MAAVWEVCVSSVRHATFSISLFFFISPPAPDDARDEGLCCAFYCPLPQVGLRRHLQKKVCPVACEASPSWSEAFTKMLPFLGPVPQPQKG